MFHRRVFAAALLMSAAVVLPAYAQDANRVELLEQQIRSLTGQVEELTFEVKKLQKQQSSSVEQAQPERKQVAAQEKPQGELVLKQSAGTLAQTDDSIEIIESGPAVSSAQEQPQAQESLYGDAVQGDVALAPVPASGLSRKKAAQAGDGGFQGEVIVDPEADPSASDAVIGDVNVDSGNGSIEQVALSPESPEDLYKKSDEALLRRQFDIAANGFTTFIKTYPDHSLAGSAQYWLGETYYSQGDFRTAAQNYLKGYQKYPKSRRAPDSLLKLGLALNKLGQKDQGCAALGNVGSEYPKAVEAKKRAQVEFRRAGC
jgi:tol-pal system protein YbgF